MDPKEALLSGFVSQPVPRWTTDDNARLHRKRYHHGSVSINNNRVLVVGGHEEDNEKGTLRSVEVYENDGWNKKWPKLNQHRAEHATVVCNNVLYIMGGCNDAGACLDSIEYLNLSSKTPKWKVLHVSLATARHGCTAVAVGRYIYIIGGKNAAGDSLDSVQVFDTATYKIFSGPFLNTKRYGAASAIVGRTLYIVGGQGQDGKALDSIESLDLNGEKMPWKTCPVKLSTPRVFPAVSIISHCIVVIGGGNDVQQELASVEVVDVKRSACWNLPPLRQARYACAAITLRNSRIVVIGGNNSITGVFDTMETLQLESLPIDTQITVVERELRHVRRSSSSLKNIFGSKKKRKQSKKQSSSLRNYLKDLKQRADSQDYNESSFDYSEQDEPLPVYDCGRIYAKRRLKDSGQAQVYRGIMESKINHSKKKKQQDTVVAIKVFKRTSDWDDCKVELMALLRAPNHPNVMDILDFYEVPKPAFVMKFVAGGDLRDYLDKKGRMKGKQAVQVLSGIGNGILHLHKNGIVHRDLKSLNILLERKGKTLTPVLIDLGLGKTIRNPTDEMQTVGCLGTASWMAPEMASEGKWSTKTDMFALGVIMWEVLTGAYPFPSMGWNQVLAFVVRENGRPDTNTQAMKHAKVTKSQQALVESLWHQDPSRRPSAQEFLVQLKACSSSK